MGEAIPFNPQEERAMAERNRARRGRAPSGGPGGPALPHSLEAERGVIAACCLDATELGRFQQRGLNFGAFYSVEGGEAWMALCALAYRGVAVDAGVLFAELQQLGKTAAAQWVLEASAGCPTSAQANGHCRRVVEMALRRRLIATAAGLIERGHDLTEPTEAIAADASAKILAVTGDRTGLPAILRDEEFEACPLPVPPMLIDQVMHLGRRTMLVAPSKASKTFTALDITCAVSTGSAWLGFKTHQVPVLHIDLELPTWGLKQRRQALREARGITKKMDVDWWSLDGYQRSIDELLPLISARAPLGKFGLIVVEPAYVIMGRRDENDNADVTDFMNQLAWLTRLTGAAVLCTHHMGKGAPGDKQVKDRASGAGAWMRAPDTAIMLTPLSEEQGDDVYSMEFIERNMKRHAPVGVRFEYPVFRLQSGLDLNALREAGRPKESTARDVVKVLEREGTAGGLTWAQLMKASGLSESTFKRRLREAIEEGRISQCGPLYVTAKTD